MSDFISELRRAYESLRDEHGDFALFAALVPEDTPDRWDVVASAPWLGSAVGDYRVLIKGVYRHLSEQHRGLISRVVIIDPSELTLGGFPTHSRPGDHRGFELANFDFSGVAIRRAHVFQLDRGMAKAAIHR